MRIPDGDLAPARRRRYGGSYGRRRRRNLRVVMAALVVLAGAGAVYVLQQDDATAPTGLAQQPCPTPTATSTGAPVVALPRPQQVRVTLLNGTPRNGLAQAIGDQLAAQGFVVLSQGNAPAALGGASRIAYAPDAAPAATVLSRWVIGSVTTSNPRVPRGTVQVTLGSAFHRLATPAEVAAAAGRATPAATPSPTPSRLDCSI